MVIFHSYVSLPEGRLGLYCELARHGGLHRNQHCFRMTGGVFLPLEFKKNRPTDDEDISQNITIQSLSDNMCRCVFWDAAESMFLMAWTWLAAAWNSAETRLGHRQIGVARFVGGCLAPGWAVGRMNHSGTSGQYDLFFFSNQLKTYSYYMLLH